MKVTSNNHYSRKCKTLCYSLSVLTALFAETIVWGAIGYLFAETLVNHPQVSFSILTILPGIPAVTVFVLISEKQMPPTTSEHSDFSENAHHTS
jgi:hypothetical protein